MVRTCAMNDGEALGPHEYADNKFTHALFSVPFWALPSLAKDGSRFLTVSALQAFRGRCTRSGLPNHDYLHTSTAKLKCCTKNVPNANVSSLLRKIILNIKVNTPCHSPQKFPTYVDSPFPSALQHVPPSSSLHHQSQSNKRSNLAHRIRSSTRVIDRQNSMKYSKQSF